LQLIGLINIDARNSYGQLSLSGWWPTRRLRKQAVALPATHSVYVVAYVMAGSQPVHELHALDLSTLHDKAHSPVQIKASNTLSDGSSYRDRCTGEPSERSKTVAWNWSCAPARD
jgi:hypothetical protein